MPELPEVENVRRDLETGWGPDCVVEQVRLFRKDLRYALPSAQRCKSLYGRRPAQFLRIGKFLVLNFESQYVVSHLGMSGSWSWSSQATLRRPHDHIEIILSDGARLIYHDPRRFGSFEILSENEFLNKPALKTMGPDPLNSKLGAREFRERYKNSQRVIKVLLMDQKVVAGVGNIYACEALFQAGVHPERTASRVSLQQWEKILKVLPQILKRSVRHGGTTLKDFVHASGEKGAFQHRLKVYGRAGEPCDKCGQPIVVKVVGQRSTYWCPRCQK